MEDLRRIVAHHPFLAGLADDHLDFLTECASNHRFDPSQPILREGEAADAVYLIREGVVGLEIVVPGNGRRRVETLSSGDVLGWSWQFPPFRWQADARAMERSLLLRIDGRCLLGKLEADPAFGYQMTRRFMQAMHHRLERVRLQRLDVYRGGEP